MIVTINSNSNSHSRHSHNNNDHIILWNWGCAIFRQIHIEYTVTLAELLED